MIPIQLFPCGMGLRVTQGSGCLQKNSFCKCSPSIHICNPFMASLQVLGLFIQFLIMFFEISTRWFGTSLWNFIFMEPLVPQFSSVQSLSRVRLCDPMNCSTPGLPVHYQLPEFTQTHFHLVGDAIHPAISSSVVPFSSCLQSLPASESFPMSQLFTWGAWSTGVSALASVLPINTQDWSPLGWTGWISLQSKGLSRVFSNTTVQKHQFFCVSFLHSPTFTSIHNHWKNHSLDQTDLCWQSNVSAFEYAI